MKRALSDDQDLSSFLGSLKKPTSLPKVKILVDGLYGSDKSLFTGQNLTKMCNETVRIIEEEWKLDWSSIIWVSTMGTWSKAVPVMLMLQGRGTFIHFHAPSKEMDPTRPGLHFEGSCGGPLMRSHSFFEKRLSEGSREAACEPVPLMVRMKNLINQNVGDLRLHQDWKEQKAAVQAEADRMIHFIHQANDGTELTADKKREQDHVFGGLLFDHFHSHKAHGKGQKVQVNLATLILEQRGLVPSALM